MSTVNPGTIKITASAGKMVGEDRWHGLIDVLIDGYQTQSLHTFTSYETADEALAVAEVKEPRVDRRS